jgi:hypothetical protein
MPLKQQSAINWVAVQIFLRFQGKKPGLEANFREINKVKNKDSTPEPFPNGFAVLHGDNPKNYTLRLFL